MIDLDAIKSERRNDAEHSAQMLLMHVWRERVKLHSELCAGFLRDGCTSAEFERLSGLAADEALRRVRIPLFDRVA